MTRQNSLDRTLTSGAVERKTKEQTAIARHAYTQLPRRPLIVCASLVQNPANLGGLCRTTESFRLEALVLADLAIAQAQPFKNLAASAHHWQPLIDCSVQRLPGWLEQQRSLGYCLIALESCPSAMLLTEFVYPSRSVLLLGKELTGIPPALVQVCDWVVSIPQAGMVESLNVQTAGAIAIYEYARQHPLRYLSTETK